MIKIINNEGKEEPFLKQTLVNDLVDSGIDYIQANKVATKIKKEFKDRKKVKAKTIRKRSLRHIARSEVIDESEEESEEKSEKDKSYLDRIREIENELKEKAAYEASQDLILSFKDKEVYNQFLKAISEKDNVKEKEVENYESNIVARVKVFSPTRMEF